MVYHYQYIPLPDINSASTDTNTGLCMQFYLHCLVVYIPKITKLPWMGNFGAEKKLANFVNKKPFSKFYYLPNVLF